MWKWNAIQFSSVVTLLYVLPLDASWFPVVSNIGKDFKIALFKEFADLLGDVDRNGDGEVDIEDILAITDEPFDVDGDGDADDNDIALVKAIASTAEVAVADTDEDVEVEEEA